VYYNKLPGKISEKLNFRSAQIEIVPVVADRVGSGNLSFTAYEKIVLFEDD
jgi:hypothetical protein